METAHNNPVKKQYHIGCYQHGQGINQHGAGCITCRLNITTVETYKGEYHDKYGKNKNGE